MLSPLIQSAPIDHYVNNRIKESAERLFRMHFGYDLYNLSDEEISKVAASEERRKNLNTWFAAITPMSVRGEAGTCEWLRKTIGEFLSAVESDDYHDPSLELEYFVVGVFRMLQMDIDLYIEEGIMDEAAYFEEIPDEVRSLALKETEEIILDMECGDDGFETRTPEEIRRECINEYRDIREFLYKMFLQDTDFELLDEMTAEDLKGLNGEYNLGIF